MSFDASAPQAGGTAAAPLLVLIAEADAAARGEIGQLITQAGFAVESVCNGRAALERVASGRFPLLVANGALPDMDGASLCRQVRALAPPQRTHIVVLGSAAGADAERALQAGADDYLRTPVQPAELLVRLQAGRRLLELEHALQEAKAQIERLSLTDALTGAYNRRYVDRRLPVEIEDARRRQGSLAVIMADLDRFTHLNESYGRPVGDEILLGFAHRAAPVLRAADWMARFGSEQFLFVLPGCGATAAEQVAERVRASVAEHPFATAAGPLPVTVSLGVVGLSVGREEAAAQVLVQLLREADNALYASKQRGRNRVTCFVADGGAGRMR
jgi:two-component system cell cycle response regulator